MNKTTIEILRYIFGCDDGSTVRRSGAPMPIVRGGRHHNAAIQLQRHGLVKLFYKGSTAYPVLYVAAHNYQLSEDQHLTP